MSFSLLELGLSMAYSGLVGMLLGLLLAQRREGDQ